MKIFRNKKKLIKEISNFRDIAFVPTMGALHDGHLSLIKKAKKRSKKVLVSIYVNPKQFSKKNDFKKYPRKLNKDISILRKIKINYLYIPTTKDVYTFNPKIEIYLNKFARILCGKFRPGHFKGVLDIVNRFLEIIRPKLIFLGLKDFQQLSLIESHIIKNKIKTKVVRCATIREGNGLALSSRNIKLQKEDLLKTGNIYKFIKNNKKLILNKILKKKKLEIVSKIIKLGANKVDYIECIDLDKRKVSKNLNSKFNVFIAYYISKVRLIDNL